MKKTAGYKGNPDGKDIYPVEIGHGYGEPLAGGTDVMRKLQNLLLVEQGSEPRSESPRLANLTALEEVRKEAKKLNRIWVVRDPGPESELEDIMFDASPDSLASTAIGTGLAQWKRENHTFHDAEGSARMDAMARLRDTGSAMKSANWEEGEKDEGGWDPGHRIPDEFSEGEGSLIPGILDKRSSLTALQKMADEIESKFEKGVPADPTENMTPEDKKKWKEQNDAHKNQFKDARQTENDPLDEIKKMAEENSGISALERLAGIRTAGHRPLNEIAQEIYQDWKNVNFAAKPYLQAMKDLDQITDSYGMDSASSIVAYFLSNASQWKGEKAKAVKAELKKILQSGRRGSSEKMAAANTVTIMKDFLERDWPLVKQAIGSPDFHTAIKSLKKIQNAYFYAVGLNEYVIDLKDTSEAMLHIRGLLDALSRGDETAVAAWEDSFEKKVLKEWRDGSKKYLWQQGLRGEQVQNVSKEISEEAFGIGNAVGEKVMGVFFEKGPDAARNTLDKIKAKKKAGADFMRKLADGSVIPVFRSWAFGEALPEGRIHLKDATLEFVAVNDEIESKFEEGVPADPTENMSEEDAKKWRLENLKNKDKFKEDKTGTFEDPYDGFLARYEEGIPADPTENMSPEDARKWKEQNEKHKDLFKEAGGTFPVITRFVRIVGTLTEGMVRDIADMKIPYWTIDGDYNIGGGPTFSVRGHQVSPMLTRKQQQAGERREMMLTLELPFDVKKPDDLLEALAGFLKRRNRTLEIDFPSKWKPVKKGTNEKKDAKEWQDNAEKHKSVFKSAGEGPAPNGRNWKEQNGVHGQRWFWTDKTGPSFGVFEFEGPGIPLYRLQILMEDGNQYKWRHPVKKPQDAFKVASFWWKALTSEAGGLVDLTRGWSKMASVGKTGSVDPIIRQIGDAVKGKNLVDLRPTLERIFPKKSIDFSFEGGAHFTISHKGKKIIIVNKKNAEDAELVVDNIAIGRMASETVRAKFEEGVPADPTVNMTPEDKAKWETMNEEHKDRFKAATVEPSGLYGHTKRTQADCEACIRKLSGVAEKIARNVWKKDEQVAPFLASHARRSGSLPAAILIDALKGVGPKVASDGVISMTAAGRAPAGLAGSQERIWDSVWMIAVNDTDSFLKHQAEKAVDSAFSVCNRNRHAESVSDFHKMRKKLVSALETHWGTSGKTAGSYRHGLYGFNVKTSALGLNACTAVHEAAGNLAAELHDRRSDRHSRITDFFRKHAKEVKCARSRLLLSCYPDAPAKTASVPVSVRDWLDVEV